jgi:hypothetical protein
MAVNPATLLGSSLHKSQQTVALVRAALSASASHHYEKQCDCDGSASVGPAAACLFSYGSLF